MPVPLRSALFSGTVLKPALLGSTSRRVEVVVHSSTGGEGFLWQVDAACCTIKPLGQTVCTIKMAKITRREMLLATTAATAAPFFIRATANAQSVDESGFVFIGGIDQWIDMQGQNGRNPIILFLHGGPAEAESPFL